MSGRLTFIGVTTGRSSIMRIFPRWASELGLDGTPITGCDLPIHAAPERYREVVERLRDDPEEAGALVTTHKVDLYEACRDIFDELDHYAELCGEVSCLSKREGSFRGQAKDPISSGASLEEIVPAGHWGRTRGHVLCLGAGGSAIAISVHLLTREDPADRPARIVTVNRTPGRLDTLGAIHERLGEHGVELDYVHNSDPEVNDALMAELPPGSLVINATGMGKDTPGSPVTDSGSFPDQGLVWELNYRGELDFLHQARRQADERGLAVHDGWSYFIHGWTAVISEVYGLEIGPDRLRRLSDIAAHVRDDTTATPRRAT
jgi:shikimate dehydrogenase